MLYKSLSNPNHVNPENYFSGRQVKQFLTC
jgi:hypothetical protein